MKVPAEHLMIILFTTVYSNWNNIGIFKEFDDLVSIQWFHAYICCLQYFLLISCSALLFFV